MQMTTSEIRTAFLEYYRSHGHQIVSSSSLVPHNDPTLLFTNAGMNQFKDVFLGAEVRPYKRATTAQRCVRAGGKHNDLDNVGYTARHHTFFEMLGNFSFGDYFKHDAIRFAWGFLTGVLQLPKDKLWVTVYLDDDEAAAIWENEIGIQKDRIVRLGAKSNFWQMGDTGPCGPCTEIFYDHGEDVQGGPPGSPDEDGDRFIEIWNLVFMQFNRHADGKLDPLPKPSVDTGMGIERVAAIMQHVHSNYEIDVFQVLIKAAGDIVGSGDLSNKSLRVIADHIRSCSFLITDGVMPSNEGRGYVLRRIIRRAVRHGRKLGATDTFFYKLVGTLVALMGEAYPELKDQQPVVERVLKVEEEQFVRTLDRGLALLEDELTRLGAVREIPGSVVFKLYDTYGFPADLTADVVRDRGYTIDEAGFEEEMKKQRARAKEASSFTVNYNDKLKIEGETAFSGYDVTQKTSTIIALYQENAPVSQITPGSEVFVVLDDTPFYAESGGQVGDTGVLRLGENLFAVTETLKVGNVIIHKGYVEQGAFTAGQKVEAAVDAEKRAATARHHSATHLLHAALRKTLGEHVAQKGSSVGPEHLRFDFSHFESLTTAQLRQVEYDVNAEIRRNDVINTQVMDVEAAKASGAMALFGEKYGDEVRVVKMGEFSTELCGGTHAHRTGDIGFFKIVSESGIASGVRRIEAVVGEAALVHIHQMAEQLDETASMLKCDAMSVVSKVHQVLDRSRQLEKDTEQLKAKLAAQASGDLVSQVIRINNTQVLIAQLDGVDAKSLRTTLDDLKNRLQSAVIVLATANDGKVSVIAGVTADLTAKVKAGDVVNVVATQVGGKGGGRPDMAQAGGTDVTALPAALTSMHTWLEERL
jgi:alanyl-tRNA synthetase